MGSFLVVAVLVAVAAAVGYTNSQTLSRNTNEVFENRLKPIEQLGAASAAMYRIRGEVYKYILIVEDREAAAEAVAPPSRHLRSTSLSTRPAISPRKNRPSSPNSTPVGWSTSGWLMRH